ncbi:MAG: hypothetical protein QHC79_25560 [Pseudosphingobacterium sp.]|nr:hypothetical protein [Pseudosphingobacterium sp.]
MTISGLKEFFQGRQLPVSIKFSEAEYISDLKLFLESHFTVAEARAGIPTFSSFHLRLEKVKEIIEQEEAGKDENH